MPLIASRSFQLKHFCRRLALWMLLSTGFAGAANFVAQPSGDDRSGAAEPLPAQAMGAVGDNSSSPGTDPDCLNLDRLTELYSGERPARIVTMEGFNTSRASLQPAKPAESLLGQLGPAPVLPRFKNSFLSPPKTDDRRGADSLSHSEAVYVGGGLAGTLPQN